MPAVAASPEVTRPRARRTRKARRGAATQAKREHPKLIRFTAAELARVRERARLAGRPMACYIREASLGPAPRVRRTEFSDSVIRTLARLATSLTTLAQHARDQHLADAAHFEAAVDDVLALIRELD